MLFRIREVVKEGKSNNVVDVDGSYLYKSVSYLLMLEKMLLVCHLLSHRRQVGLP